MVLWMIEFNVKLVPSLNIVKTKPNQNSGLRVIWNQVAELKSVIKVTVSCETLIEEY